MTEPSPCPDEWEPCQPGTIFDASLQQTSELRKGRRKYFIRVVAGTFSGIVLAIFLILYFQEDPNANADRPGIGCVQVHRNLAAYADYTIEDTTLRGQISQHLYKCVSCRQACETLVRGEQIYDCCEKTKLKHVPIRRP